MLGQYQDILTILELCEILMIGRNRAYELLQTGAIKGFKIGRVWKIPRESVEEFIHTSRSFPISSQPVSENKSRSKSNR